MSSDAPLVVVADDNADIRRLVERRLGRRGYTILSAPDGDTALALIRAQRPAAAVLDWMMPGMHGDAVCHEVKHDPRTASIPVVLLTARATQEDRSAGLEAGADDFLTKPFAIDELDAVLRRLLDRR